MSALHESRGLKGETDERLAARIPDAADEEANELWKELTARNEPLLRTVAGRCKMPIGDLLSDLYVHLKGDSGWNRLRTFAARPGTPFQHWLAVVAGRLARRNAALAGHVREEKLEEYAVADADLGRVPTRVALLQMIGRLEHAECRGLIRRRYWSDDGYDVIARDLGRTQASVRQIHHRNLVELRKLMQEEDDG
jgi:DNA-directed RNA polymerase specialized sigma24 family protein